MMVEAGFLDAFDKTCREYERVVDPKYLDQIRAEEKAFFSNAHNLRARQVKPGHYGLTGICVCDVEMYTLVS